MKRAIFLIAILCIAAPLVLMASGGQEKTGAKATEAKKFAFCLEHVNNEFMQGLASAVQAAGKEAGVDVTVYSADLDTAKQVSQVETCITQGYAGIILCSASTEGLVGAVKDAIQAKVPIMTLHSDVTAGVSPAFVGVDFAQGGQAKMEQCAKDLGGKGNICIMNGEMGNSAQLAIRSGYEVALKNHPDIKVVFEDTGHWTAEPAAKLTETWLASGKQIDAIVCNNDGMALGVVSALKAAGKNGKILVYGLDAQSQALKEIADGNMAATILTDSAGEAKAAFATMFKMINNQTFPKVQMIPMIVINKDNVKSYYKAQ
jgi:ribose transport system substrate-binding protein/inositol transport system substrate-binding protein